jgi:hypothetical protein
MDGGLGECFGVISFCVLTFLLFSTLTVLSRNLNSTITADLGLDRQPEREYTFLIARIARQTPSEHSKACDITASDNFRRMMARVPTLTVS